MRHKVRQITSREQVKRGLDQTMQCIVVLSVVTPWNPKKNAGKHDRSNDLAGRRLVFFSSFACVSAVARGAPQRATMRDSGKRGEALGNKFVCQVLENNKIKQRASLPSTDWKNDVCAHGVSSGRHWISVDTACGGCPPTLVRQTSRRPESRRDRAEKNDQKSSPRTFRPPLGQSKKDKLLPSAGAPPPAPSHRKGGPTEIFAFGTLASIHMRGGGFAADKQVSAISSTMVLYHKKDRKGWRLFSH